MTEKIFWQDPYLTSLPTQITSVQDHVLTVEKTIFYAFAGGQESDAGTIENRPVLEARKEGREIFYTLGEGHGLKVGDAVTMHLDWQRRYSLMRLHFAVELVLESTYRLVQGIPKIGAHIAADKSRIDFEWGENLNPLLPTLKTQVLDLITANHPIISAFSDPLNERRYWEIEGWARVACGGTHLKTTGEIGAVDLKRKNVGKGKERIEIYLIG